MLEAVHAGMMTRVPHVRQAAAWARHALLTTQATSWTFPAMLAEHAKKELTFPASWAEHARKERTSSTSAAQTEVRVWTIPESWTIPEFYRRAALCRREPEEPMRVSAGALYGGLVCSDSEARSPCARLRIGCEARGGIGKEIQDEAGDPDA